MSGLVEFLLARIAEDEAPTWTLMPYDCEPGCCAPKDWVGSQCRYCDPAPVYGGTVEAIAQSAEGHAEAIHQRSRVLAKCAADRRIVAKADEAGAQRERYSDGDLARIYGGRGALAEHMLCLLALPYADHSEYRSEWAP